MLIAMKFNIPIRRNFNKNKSDNYEKRNSEINKTTESENSMNDETKKCYRCGYRGHIAPQCRTRMPRNSYQYTSNKHKNEANPAKEEIAVYYASAVHIEDTNNICNVTENKWCLDSGCTAHLCKNKDKFVEIKATTDILNLANKNSTKVEGKGTVVLKVQLENSGRIVHLENALLVSDLRSCLMLVVKIVDQNNEVIFKKEIANIHDKEGRIK